MSAWGNIKPKRKVIQEKKALPKETVVVSARPTPPLNEEEVAKKVLEKVVVPVRTAKEIFDEYAALPKNQKKSWTQMFSESISPFGYYQVTSSGGAQSGSLPSPAVGCRAQAGSQTTVVGDLAGYTTVTFDTSVFDTSSLLDAEHPTKITFPENGIYTVGSSVALVTTNAVTGLRVLLNGTTAIAEQREGNSGGGVPNESVSITTTYEFTAGDYVEFQVSSSVDTLTIASQDTNMWCTAVNMVGTGATSQTILDTALTGFSSQTGTVTSTDTILQGIQKLWGNSQDILNTVLSPFITRVGTVGPTDSILTAIEKLSGSIGAGGVGTATPLTGFVSGPGSVTSADTILTAFEKINGNVALLGSGETISTRIHIGGNFHGVASPTGITSNQSNAALGLAFREVTDGAIEAHVEGVDGIRLRASTTGSLATGEGTTLGTGGTINITGAVSPHCISVIRTTSGTSRHRVEVGFSDRIASSVTNYNSDPTNAVYFLCNATTNWFAVTRSADVETSTDTGIAVDSANYQLLDIQFDAGMATFTINNAVVATSITNIPTVALAAYVGNGLITSTVGGVRNIDVSSFDVWWNNYSF